MSLERRIPTFHEDLDHSALYAARVERDSGHINGGVRLGNWNSSDTPKIHSEIGATQKVIPERSTLEPMHELSPAYLTDAINRPTTAIIDAYNGSDPRGLLRLRRFVLSKTIVIAEKKEAQTYDDLITTWHLADTIQRGASSRMGIKGSAVEEALGASTDPSLARPTTFRQEHISRKLQRRRKKWLMYQQRGEHFSNSYNGYATPGTTNISRNTSSGIQAAAATTGKAKTRKQRYLDVVQKEANRYNEAALKAETKRAKIDAINRVI